VLKRQTAFLASPRIRAFVTWPPPIFSLIRKWASNNLNPVKLFLTIWFLTATSCFAPFKGMLHDPQWEAHLLAEVMSEGSQWPNTAKASRIGLLRMKAANAGKIPDTVARNPASIF
jgi:hypothetical protein